MESILCFLAAGLIWKPCLQTGKFKGRRGTDLCCKSMKIRTMCRWLKMQAGWGCPWRCYCTTCWPCVNELEGHRFRILDLWTSCLGGGDLRALGARRPVYPLKLIPQPSQGCDIQWYKNLEATWETHESTLSKQKCVKCCRVLLEDWEKLST